MDTPENNGLHHLRTFDWSSLNYIKGVIDRKNEECKGSRFTYAIAAIYISVDENGTSSQKELSVLLKGVLKEDVGTKLVGSLAL